MRFAIENRTPADCTSTPRIELVDALLVVSCWHGTICHGRMVIDGRLYPLLRYWCERCPATVEVLEAGRFTERSPTCQTTTGSQSSRNQSSTSPSGTSARKEDGTSGTH